ncbi:NtaA/DmoA family FMN-dependent monooxygenase [Kaistia dalseonensis]|uniref:FMN-dependent oxidoreductase (Nitrilotriacetate monooxygenase family) n=1 Tax=Kaistia dalseonensis TaxID=410840 RepID=A0ABU0H0V2_9HYPH|nr:NtaA/DmoA family FMN-dependent monooxygenase [Kaistia dalseonensis]MCX5493359.1 NtaA/DmoA family FMN-dependent monooxygenase [Kaistia dalseonensis]MDQ0435917.1 FMN-dependent oxidoreductase (nitrilotriacetate monooxygenase family) [Kaistia dalseonensis]
MKTIILGAFEINQVNLTSQGLWAHPEQTTYRYKELSYWTDLAQLLERGYFDFLFLADSFGYPLLSGETPDVTFEQAVELPKNDPMLLIPALAAATSDLNFIVTTSTTCEQPYANARRFATLDHLTQGRIAWNIVTTSSAVVSELLGTRQLPHDERYAMAQDFLDLSYKLFEGSWEDGAVVVDKARRLYADPRRIHPISHEGPYFTSHGYFNSEPSPQRTPVLVQAGASATGRAFAAANVEVVFVQGKDAKMLRSQVDDLRSRAVSSGREAESLKAVSGLSVVTAASRSEAEDKLEEYLSWVNADAARAYYAMMTGVDLAKLDPNASFSTVKTEGSRTQVERYSDVSVRDASADFIRRGMRELIVVGTPSEAAEEIRAIVEETDLDGFNFTPFVTPGSYTDLIDHVVPELQRIGLMRSTRSPSTFRERLFGAGQARLPETHPAARQRVGAMATPMRNVV